MMQGRNENRRTQPNPLGTGGRCSRERQRRSQIAVVEQVVLGEPRRRGPKALGLLAHLQREAVETRRILMPLHRVPQVEVDADLDRHWAACRLAHNCLIDARLSSLMGGTVNNSSKVPRSTRS